VDLQFEIAGNQIDGARDYQEDTFLVTHLGEGAEANAVALVIVADGMGGHAAGNVASNIASSTFNKTFSTLYPTEDVPGALRQSLLAANDAIRAAVKETPALQGMGCTLVAAFLSRARLWWVSVGDSHLYLLRDRQLVKKNADHSYGGYIRRMREMGADVEPDPNLSPNMLMSAMIGEDIADIDLCENPLTLLPGDRVLLASDGMDTLGQGSVIQHSAWSTTARDCVGALLRAVEDAEQPRQDNTTVVCIDVKARAAGAPAPAREPPQARPASAPRSEPAPPTPEDAIPTLEPVDESEIPAELGPAPFARPALPAETARPLARRALAWGVAGVLLLAIGAGGTYLWLERAAPPREPSRAATVPPPGPLASAEPAPETPAPAAPTATAEPPEPVAAPTAPETSPEPVAAPAAPEASPVPPPGERVFRDPLRSGGSGPEMVMLPGGRFEMGGVPTTLNPEEQPRHRVVVPPLAVSRHEVTFAEYDRFARATGRRLPPSGDLDRDEHPVTHVTWDDAFAYAQWLSRETGQRYRLPSEAEWEYAARGGTATLYWWGNDAGKGNAHCFDCKSGLHPRQSARVGYFKANPFGLHDTAGNVAEWVHDCFHPSYVGAPEDGSVWDGGDCTRRVVRGGSFSSPASALRSPSRQTLAPTQGYDNVGIRVVRER
jgi:formylglycine-generating enzyme required for sulfatase activity/serine/threonine protein phosphatase PrpC